VANVLAHDAAWLRRAGQVRSSGTSHTTSRYTCFATNWSVLCSLVMDKIADALMQCPPWIKLDQAHQERSTFQSPCSQKTGDTLCTKQYFSTLGSPHHVHRYAVSATIFQACTCSVRCLSCSTSSPAYISPTADSGTQVKGSRWGCCSSTTCRCWSSDTSSGSRHQSRSRESNSGCPRAPHV
jgi:hypothetical protein